MDKLEQLMLLQQQVLDLANQFVIAKMLAIDHPDDQTLVADADNKEQAWRASQEELNRLVEDARNQFRKP